MKQNLSTVIHHLSTDYPQCRLLTVIRHTTLRKATYDNPNIINKATLLNRPFLGVNDNHNGRYKVGLPDAKVALYKTTWSRPRNKQNQQPLQIAESFSKQRFLQTGATPVRCLGFEQQPTANSGVLCQATITADRRYAGKVYA